MGNKNTVRGMTKIGEGKKKWGGRKNGGGRKKQKNSTVFAQYFVLIPSSTWLRLYRLLAIYFRLLCRYLLS